MIVHGLFVIFKYTNDNSVGLRKLIPVLSCLLLFTEARSQSCPQNIDFELGSFARWECMSGFVSNTTGLNEINWTSFNSDPNRHLLISGPDTTTDEYGKFPRLCPNGSGFSVKLGNGNSGGQAEGISYVFDVPTGVSNYSIFLYYAVVLEDPNHNSEQQPRFRARIVNDQTGEPVQCVNFDFTASGSLPGFQPSTVKPTVTFKNWTPITLDLTPFSGQRLKLEFITSDCTLQGHFGYAYVDVSSRCNGAVAGSIVCEGSTTGTLTAPFGFFSYTWYSDASFSTVLSTSQTLSLTPPPPNGASFPVVIEPFPGYGCRDTVYATISSAPKPPAFAGNDRTICTYESVQLGKPADPGLKYSWSPASDLLNPTTSNPYTKYNLQGVTNFVVTVTDPQTGCINEDEVTVSPVIIDTSLTVSGDLVFCNDDLRNTSLLVLVPGESVQWYGNNQAIPGATTVQYDPRPSATTSYFASISRQGCLDSTRSVIVNIPPDPRVSFRAERKLQCVKIPVTFLNTTTIPGSDTLSYTWRLQSGEEFSSKNLVTVFNSPGPQKITLKVRSGFGCEDSLSLVFDIVDHCQVNVPSAFTPNGDGLNDIFKPSLNGIKTLRRFVIYDRWGNVIYKTSTIEEGWDGRSRGMALDTGVFLWMLEYDSYDRDNVVQKGTVTLIR